MTTDTFVRRLPTVRTLLESSSLVMPEAVLWSKVIRQAIHDSRIRILPKTSTREIFIKSSAISFLFGEGLDDVCTALGLSASYIRTLVITNAEIKMAGENNVI